MNIYYLFKIYEYFVYFLFYLNKLKNLINFKLFNLYYSKIIYYKNSKIILKKTANNLDNNITLINNKLDYDYYIFISYKNNLTFCIINNINNELCEYKFSWISITFLNKKHDITNIFKNKNYYLYVVNNKLFDDNFINWFSITNFNIDFEDLKIEILDDKLNNIKINRKNYILLKKNEYIIMNKSI